MIMEMTEKWGREDQPLDLRVKSGLKRENKPYDRDYPKADDKNRILSSLLKPTADSNIQYNSPRYERFRSIHSYKRNEPKEIYSPRELEVTENCRRDVLRSFESDRDNRRLAKDGVQSDDISIVFDGKRSLTPDPETSQCVPNYRKFYSRCYSNQLSISTTNNRQSVVSQTVHSSSHSPRQNSTIRQGISISYQNRHLKVYLEDRSSSSAQFNELLSSRPLDKKDKILKCLLTHSVPAHNDSYSPERKWQNEISPRFESHRSYFRRPPLAHIYYPEAIRATPEDGILKSLLVSHDKKPDPAPFNAGSPGSESTTSSGSTDSGVFSDNIHDESKKITRALSGRYIKSGTGASHTTLKLLRQVIIERRRRNNRQL